MWLEKILLPLLKPGQVIILDNASFHKSKKNCEIIQKYGCKMLFLPPYSPDLNPIENFWANLKKRVKESISKFANPAEAINQSFIEVSI